MPDDIYESGPSDAEDDSPDIDENSEVEGKSCLIPKSIFPGEVKPGQTITLTVDSVYSDEVECSVGSTETETENPTMSADEELEGMAMGEED